MKKEQLLQIIKEEISKILKEEKSTPEYSIHPISDTSWKRMESLSNENDINDMLDAANKIMEDLTNDGFEAKEVFDFLFNQLVRI